MVYKYLALNSDGKDIEGLIEASSEDEAIGFVISKGLRVVSVEEEKSKIKKTIKGFNIVIGGRVKVKDLVVFFRQFSVMIDANVAIVPSLKTIVEQTTNVKLKMMISEIADEIDGGSRLSEAIGKRPKVFSNFHVNIVRGGETSGKLSDALIYLANEMEKDYDMVSKMRGAMIYPAFVFSGMFVVGVVMMVFVVPKLTNVLAETGAELPFATKILISTSSVMQNYWWLILFFVIVAAILIRIALLTENGQYWRDFVLLKLPIFGKLFQKIFVIRFSRSMSTMILGGITINESLEISSEVMNNKVYEKELKKAQRTVEDGGLLSDALSTNPYFPQMVPQMVSIGEKTGRADIVFGRIADFYTREANNMIANLMTLMEPIIMIIMGVAVGIMVAAIILPMYNMASQV